MEKERLIQKWLDNSLSPAEMEIFQQLEEARDYQKIAETARYFKAPDFEPEEHFSGLKNRLEQKRNSSWRHLYKIAAVMAICIATYFMFFDNQSTTVHTLAASQETLTLPDNSEVILNAGSTLNYYTNNWKQERVVQLEGEAFFKVKKGSEFMVKTAQGTVKVLGTQFNVKQRGNIYEVTCFSGLVEVVSEANKIRLGAGETFQIIGKLEKSGIIEQTIPSWIAGRSSFDGTPFSEVIMELERQYDVEASINNKSFDPRNLFTGSFDHNNLEEAVKSVSLPFNLKYDIKDGHVILY